MKQLSSSWPDKFRMSLFRILRLARLFKILHVFRLRAFDEVAGMIIAMQSGFPTMFWSSVLFGLYLYPFAVICRIVLGQSKGVAAEVVEQFETFPKAFYTVFRCATGDCVRDDGTYMIPDIYANQWGFFLWCLQIFFTCGSLQHHCGFFRGVHHDGDGPAGRGDCDAAAYG